ncbi:unnamed protein product [Urochloa humidicola]
MDFTAPSFSLGFDSDDDDPAPPTGSDRREREQARGSAAPDPPSFCLGIDFDVEEEEPRLPAGGRREDQVQGAAAPDPPSFSLGIDFDDDVEEAPQLPAGDRREERARGSAVPDPPSFIPTGGQRHEQARPQVTPRAPTSVGDEDEDDDLVLTGTKPLPSPPETNRFKRLRKGPAPAPVHQMPAPQVRRCEAPDAPSFSVVISDDDEEFLPADQHRKQPRPPAVPRAPSSFSLEDVDDDCFVAGDRSEMTPLKRLRKGPAPPRPAPALPSVKVPGPPAAKVSPLISENAEVGAVEDEIEVWTTDEDRPVRDVPPSIGSCSTSSNSKFSLLNRGVLTQSTVKANTSKFTQTPGSKSLEESCTKKLLPTITISPIRKIYLLDSDTDDELNPNEAKKPVSPVKKRQESIHKYMQEKPTFQDSHPPAMHYFFHNDLRVCDLVRGRLQHFVPIGAGSTGRGESLSYRGQFCSSATASVAKRQVHASGSGNQSGFGHWFTSDSGRKVFVSTNGQELTGRDAYRQCKKESGKGFNGYRKKGSSGTKGGAAKVKIETAAKQGTSTAKRKV